MNGSIYQHYKGGLYQYICTGLLESDGTPMAVYRDAKTGDTWVRPLGEFLEKFDLRDLKLRVERMEKKIQQRVKVGAVFRQVLDKDVREVVELLRLQRERIQELEALHEK